MLSTVSTRTIERVEHAIRAKGTLPFTGRGLGDELGLTRQSVYAAIRRLCEAGHRIEGQPKLGFMARMLEQGEAT